MPKHYRAGRVFIDWSQNDAGKSTVAPYSMRGGAIPTVAMPVEWAEVEEVATSGDHRPLVFLPGVALRRVVERGDLHERTLTDLQTLP